MKEQRNEGMKEVTSHSDGHFKTLPESFWCSLVAFLPFLLFIP